MKKYNQTLLVTGGNGYIGSVFVDHYARAHPDRRIIVVGRSAKPQLHFPVNVNVEVADCGDQPKLINIMHRYAVNRVVHLAAELDSSGAATNVTKTEALLKAMVAANVGQLVYGSSFMVYDKPLPSTDGRLNEAAPLKPISADDYAGSKRAVEALINKQPNIKAAILRLGIAIGASEDSRIGDQRPAPGILSTYLRAIRQPTTVHLKDDGSAARDFVDVLDIADAIDRSLAWSGRQKRAGTITLNVGSGRPTSINELIKIIGQVTGGPIAVSRGDNKPLVPVSYLDISNIHNELGWQPKIDTNTSVQRALQYLSNSKESQ